MCGIFGYLGKKPVIPLIIGGLKHLEYRGYDSAGVAYLDENNLVQVYKSAGKLINLENCVKNQPYGRNGNQIHVGIGHIRWATHGAANDVNAHPHASAQGNVVVVHNGIIENFAEVRKELMAKGYEFKSETDTECIAHLLEDLSQSASSEGSYLAVLREALKKLKGAYALNVIFKDAPEKLYAVRNHAPLIIGIGKDDKAGEYLVASDTVAVVDHTDEVIYLKDRELAELTTSGITIENLDGEAVKPTVEKLDMGPLRIDKKGFKHFMLKEIHEQPDVVRNSLKGRLVGTDKPVQLLSRPEDENATINELLKAINRVVIIGCGTSFNAGLIGKYFIEDLVRIPAEVEAAGEYRYRNPVLDEKTLVVAMSQSGETADTLEAIRQSKTVGAKILAITNREDSTIARESDIVLPVRAGVEVSVCATKSFVAQLIVLYLLGLKMAEIKKTSHPEILEEIKDGLIKIPTLIEAYLSDHSEIQALAKTYGHAKDVLFIARGINYPVALEGALKLKEISYIHAEGYSGSELKHGPIAMLDDELPVIAVLAEGSVFEKIHNNCQEAKARDARIVAVSNVDVSEDETFSNTVMVPKTLECLSPLITTIPLQLLSYYIAEYLGKDVDQPRNLAKSVTVE